MSTYQDKIPLEGLLRTITPKSLWFRSQGYSKDYIDQLLDQASKGIIHYEHCFHDNACSLHVWRKIIDVWLRTVKIYSGIHLLQFLFFNKSKNKYSPSGILKLLKSIMKSLLFIGTFTLFAKAGLCYCPQYLQSFSPIWCRVISGLCGAGIFFEARSRWSELTMSIATQLPEALKNYYGKQGLWYPLPMGHNLLFAFSLGVISYVYYSEEKCLKSLHQSIADLIFGKLHEKDSCPKGSPLIKGSTQNLQEQQPPSKST